MQTFKKVILVVICLVVLLTSFIQPVGAVNYYYDDSGDVWLYDEAQDVLYKEPYMEFEFPSILSLTAPNFSFDPNSLPWSEMPTHIQEIIYTSLPNFFNTDDYLKVPFLCVLRTNTYIRVVAGYNLCLGRFSTSSGGLSSGMMYLLGFANLGSYKHTVCYSADYNLDLSVKVPWHSVEPSDYGSSGYIKRFAGLGLNVDATFDLYGYGANYVKSGKTTSGTVSGGDGYQTASFVQNSNGFESGRFIPFQNNFEFAYFQSFTPKALSQIEAETQKGIWDSIKELPTKIADSIKGFFTSLGDRISGFFENLKNYLLYFQETKPEHVNPFDNLLTDVKTFFDEQLSDVDDFKLSLNSTLDNVVTYIQTGSGIVNTFLTAVPILSAFITFFVVFYVVRKVVGR